MSLSLEGRQVFKKKGRAARSNLLLLLFCLPVSFRFYLLSTWYNEDVRARARRRKPQTDGHLYTSQSSRNYTSLKVTNRLGLLEERNDLSAS